jgi:hypothetical protein
MNHALLKSCATWSTATGCQCMPGTSIFTGSASLRPLNSIKMYGWRFSLWLRQHLWIATWKSLVRMIYGTLFQYRKFPPVSACASVLRFLLVIKSSFLTICLLFPLCLSSFARMSLSDLTWTLSFCSGFHFPFLSFTFSFPHFYLSFPLFFLSYGKNRPESLNFTWEPEFTDSSIPLPFSTSYSQSPTAYHQSNTTPDLYVVRSPSINSTNG